MRRQVRLTALGLAAAMGVAAVPVAAQWVVSSAAGYATVNIAGLGNATTVAGEARIPILPRDVHFDAVSHRLRLRATGRRGPVRQLDIEVQGARSGGRYELGGSPGAWLRVRTDQGEELTAESGRGWIHITLMDNRRVSGTYEGTFQRGQVPVVIRGRFEANFPGTGTVGGTPSTGR